MKVLLILVAVDGKNKMKCLVESKRGTTNKQKSAMRTEKELKWKISMERLTGAT